MRESTAKIALGVGIGIPIGIASVTVLLVALTVNHIRTDAEASKPELPVLPVGVSFRHALLSDGYVAVLHNQSRTMLPLSVTAVNAATHQMHQWHVVLDAGHRLDIGSLDGWIFAAGDELDLQNDGYRAGSYRIAP